jgi:hypothetical protein
MFLIRASKPGADARAPADDATWGSGALGTGTAATGTGAAELTAAASIGWPQLPQKRAFAGTGLLHLEQFMGLSLRVAGCSRLMVNCL